MKSATSLLTPLQETSLVRAIQQAEKLTSGEIRIHLENRCKKNVNERAKEVFHNLNMDKTKAANGVLIYLAVKDKQFAIIGDSGIDKKVGQDFWDTTKQKLEAHFKNGRFIEGLQVGVYEAGKILSEHFPYSINDLNELSNQISTQE